LFFAEVKDSLELTNFFFDIIIALPTVTDSVDQAEAYMSAAAAGCLLNFLQCGQWRLWGLEREVVIQPLRCK
jgi:hypothetical protein